MKVFLDEVISAEIDGQYVDIHKIGEGDYKDAEAIFRGSAGYCAENFVEDAKVYKAAFSWSSETGRGPGKVVGFLRGFGRDIKVHHETSTETKIAFDKGVTIQMKTVCKDGVCYSEVVETPYS